MSQDAFDIDRIAELARIKLKPEERTRLGNDLKNILSYVEKMKSLDVSQVEPTSHVLNIQNVFREDKARDAAVIKKVIQHAPSAVNTYFKVPKVVEG